MCLSNRGCKETDRDADTIGGVAHRPDESALRQRTGSLGKAGEAGIHTEECFPDIGKADNTHLA